MQGKHLASLTTGGNTYDYYYDLDGIRTQKVVNDVTHTYITQNGKVVRESFPYGDTTIIMDFIYDESGRPFSVAYSKNGGTSFTNYFYATNAQGDVEGIFRVLLNEDTGLYEQKWYGRYLYDAWGNVTATTAAGNTPDDTSLVVRNPIRYRGYYYDNETGFYYLQSRYYDPANHRFINADAYASTGQGFLGYNMFSYCNNNSANRADNAGMASWHFAVMVENRGPSYNVHSPSEASIQLKEQVQQILKKPCYSQDVWDGLNSSKRLRLLNELASEICKSMGIPEREVRDISNDPNRSGGISGVNGGGEFIGVVISKNYAVPTVVHELYHSYQFDIINGVIEHNEPHAVVMMWTADSKIIYSTEQRGLQSYHNSPMEISAYWFENNISHQYNVGDWEGYYE